MISVTFISMILINIYKKYKERKNGYIRKKDEFTNFFGIGIALLFSIITIVLIVLLVMTYQDYINSNEIFKIISKNQLYNLLYSISFNLLMIYLHLNIWKIRIFKSGVVCIGKSIKWNLIDYVEIEIDNFGIYTVKINYGKDKILLFLINKHGKRFESILRNLNIKQILTYSNMLFLK